MKKILILAALLSGAAFAFAETASVPPYLARFPDIYEARLVHYKAVLMTRLPKFLEFAENVQETAYGKVLCKVESGKDFAYALFLRERNGGNPLVSAGNTILQRETTRGFITFAKIFLNDDPSCYIRYSPVSDQSKFDIVVYGAVVAQDVRTGLNFIMQFGRPLDLVASQWKDRASVFRGADPEGPRERFVRLADAGSAASFFAALGKVTPGADLPAATYKLFASDADPRAIAPYAPLPTAKTGMPLSALRAAVFQASTRDAAARQAPVAYLATGDGVSLLLVPHVGAYGTTEVAAYSTATRKRVDMAALVAEKGSVPVTAKEVALPE